MVSFEEKRIIFKSFPLKEKKISNGRVNFVYPESKQKGQVLARELQPSGNGYVIGKYMADEVVKKNDYKLDARGWISIKDFTKDELAKVITEAMKSMSGENVTNVPVKEEVPMADVEETHQAEADQVSVKIKTVQISAQKTDDDASAGNEPAETLKLATPSTAAQSKPVDPSIEHEHYPLSFGFCWVGLSLSLMETGYLIWRNAIRKYGEFRKK